MHKLTELQPKALSKPGRHADGGGLYLRISQTGSKSWAFIHEAKSTDGKRRRHEIGLGSYPAIGLADARKFAVSMRETVASGGSPLVEKQRETEPTFAECVDLYIAAKSSEWSNA